MKEKNKDNLDNEIWVQNKIEEAREETENLIYEQIKSLDYNKTIKDINEAVQELSKKIELVDYNKSRALEGMEEDFNIKLDDIKTLDSDAIRDTIIDITGETISKSKTSIEKTLKKEINKAFNQIELVKENNKAEELAKSFEEYKTFVNIDEIKQQQITAKQNIEELEKAYKEEIKKAIAELNQKIDKSVSTSIEELRKKQLAVGEQTHELEEKILKYQKEISDQIHSVEENRRDIIEYKNMLDKSMADLLKSQTNIEKDFVTYQKDMDEDFATHKQAIDEKANSIEEVNNKIIQSQTGIEEKIDKLSQEQGKMKKEFIENTKIIIPDVENCKEELFKVRENSANKILDLEKKLNERIDAESQKTEQKMANKIDAEEMNKSINFINQRITKKNDENQKKMLELQSRQEDFINQIVNQNNNAETIEEIKQDINNINMQLKNIKKENQYMQEENLEEIKDYIEKRILRMKYVNTIQALVQEINKLNKKIKILQTAFDSNSDNDDERILKLVDKQVRQTIAQMIKEQKQAKTKKQSATVNKKTEQEKVQIIESKQKTRKKDMDNISLQEALKDSPVEKIVNTTRAISNIAKGIRKSQILNSPDEQD